MKLPAILFEDADIVAFDKPAGMLVATDRWDRGVENIMDVVHRNMSAGTYNAHRLDRDTSGVLLCAKRKKALDRICGQFQSGSVSNRYIAIVRATPECDETVVDLGIDTDQLRPDLMRTVRHGGKPAYTAFKILRKWRGYTLVEALPRTGRTHQIRVHLAAIKCPIVADTLYGDGHGILLSELKRGYKHKKDRPERPLIGRLALHAERLTFKHPESGEDLTIASPLPHDFELAISYLDRFAK